MIQSFKSQNSFLYFSLTSFHLTDVITQQQGAAEQNTLGPLYLIEFIMVNEGKLHKCLPTIRPNQVYSNIKKEAECICPQWLIIGLTMNSKCRWMANEVKKTNICVYCLHHIIQSQSRVGKGDLSSHFPAIDQQRHEWEAVVCALLLLDLYSVMHTNCKEYVCAWTDGSSLQLQYI